MHNPSVVSITTFTSFASWDDRSFNEQSVENHRESIMKKDTKERDFSNTLKVLIWNRRILSMVGVWPLKTSEPVFLSCFLYCGFLSGMGIANMIDYRTDFEYFLTNITENMLMIMTLLKIAICRVNKRSMAQFLTEIEEDFSIENYKSDKEKTIFLNYNRLSYRFITIAVPLMAVITTLYYFKAIVTSTVFAVSNSTFEYQLPYKIRPIVKPYDMTSYVFGCISQWPVVPVIVFGYTGIDCLFASSTLHVTSQFVILRHRITEIFKDTNNYQQKMKILIIRHYRLIRLAEILEDGFNLVIFQQLLGTTFHLCMSGYHMLVSLADVQTMKIIIFVLHACAVSSTLFVYCYVGECLIEESMNFGETFYHSDWYELSPVDLKLIYICMIRARKPLQLTSAKFCALSLYTFSDVLKASMGYLSVLRNFL